MAGRPEEQRAAGFVAQNDDHGRFCASSIWFDPAAFVHRQIADLVEIGGNTHDLAAGLEKVADGANIACAG